MTEGNFRSFSRPRAPMVGGVYLPSNQHITHNQICETLNCLFCMVRHGRKATTHKMEGYLTLAKRRRKELELLSQEIEDE